MPKSKTMKPAKGKDGRPTLVKVEMMVDTVADENKDAFLGRSEGIKNSLNQRKMSDDVEDVLNARLHNKMVAPKVFGHGLHMANITDQVNTVVQTQDEDKSVKGFSRLSNVITPIPRSSSISKNEKEDKKRDGESSEGSPRAMVEARRGSSKQEKSHPATGHEYLDLNKYIKKDQPKKVQTFSPFNDKAPELEENCVQVQIEKFRIQNLQAVAGNTKVTDDFRTGYPEYYEILSNYSKSRIFAWKYQTLQNEASQQFEDEKSLKDVNSKQTFGGTLNATELDVTGTATKKTESLSIQGIRHGQHKDIKTMRVDQKHAMD